MSTRYTIEGNVPKGQVVNPSGSQPRYTRGSANNQTSSELKGFQQCVAEKMADEGGSRMEVRDAFKSAAQSCS